MVNFRSTPGCNLSQVVDYHSRPFPGIGCVSQATISDQLQLGGRLLAEPWQHYLCATYDATFDNKADSLNSIDARTCLMVLRCDSLPLWSPEVSNLCSVTLFPCLDRSLLWGSLVPLARSYSFRLTERLLALLQQCINPTLAPPPPSLLQHALVLLAHIEIVFFLVPKQGLTRATRPHA